MIEIFVVYSICKKTVANAKARGKKTGIAIMYTIMLWLGMEFYGAIITGFAIGFLGLSEGWDLLIYVFAIGFAAIGGYLAVLISKVAKPIYEVEEPASPFVYGKNGTTFWNRDLRKGEHDISNKWDK